MHAPSNASLVDAATPVDPLACALADCPACLGAYLAALDQAPHPTTCSCGNVWTAARRPRAAPVDVPADLEALARWLPTIAGRALPLGDAGGASGGRLDGRPDHVDERHRDARSGLRTALTALSTLDAMERAGEARHVKILWFAYVLTGPELAGYRDARRPSRRASTARASPALVILAALLSPKPCKTTSWSRFRVISTSAPRFAFSRRKAASPSRLVANSFQLDHPSAVLYTSRP